MKVLHIHLLYVILEYNQLSYLKHTKMIKKATMLSLLLMSFWALCQGINFEEGNFKSVLAKAKKENKLVFVDAYTVWCAPCRLMAKNIFPLKSVGDYYNSNFINIKMDMEKGEGKVIAKKYNITSFPTYLIVNGDGETIHRSGSSSSEQEFLQFGKDSQDPDRQYPLIKKKFEKGNNDPEFLLNAANVFFKGGDRALAIDALDQHFQQKQTNDLTRDEINTIITFIYNHMSEKYYTFFLERKEDILKVISPASYDSYDSNFKRNIILDKSMNPKTHELDEGIFLSEAEKIFGKEKAPQILLKEKARMALNKKDIVTYEKLTLDLYKNYSVASSGELNSAAWGFFENVDNRSSLEKAVLWAQESVKKTPEYGNTDTLANLYHKIGDQKNAKVWAEKAIELAKISGTDSSDTQKLLDSLQ